MGDLPDIKFKKKKEKKGFLPWLRQKLGFGPAAGAEGLGGAASRAPSMVNLGRVFGTAKIGASSSTFLGGLLASKGILFTAAVVAAAVGAGLYMSNQPSGVDKASSAFSSGGTRKAQKYVPAIERHEQSGSSLDMFTKANEGKWPGEGESAESAADEDNLASAEEEARPEESPQPERNNMAQEMMAKLQAGDIGSLTSSLGNGSNKFSSVGGFGNKFGSGQFGPKVGFSNNVGSGFQSLPGFQARKKMLAMKAGKRAMIGKIGGGHKSKYGKGAYAQAKGIRKTQKTYAGGSIDALRGTQDKAWEGSTEDGTVSAGGGGISAGSGGGTGVVSSPSLDNGQTAGGANPYDDMAAGNAIPTDFTPTDVSPWASLINMAMTLIMISAVLSAIGGTLVKSSVPWVQIIGYILCGIAMALGLMAIMAGVMVMSQFGQTMLGMVYILGGGVAVTAAGMAMAGKTIGSITPMWMSAIAGIIGLLGSMMGTPVGNMDNITGDDTVAEDSQTPGGGGTSQPEDGQTQQQQ